MLRAQHAVGRQHGQSSAAATLAQNHRHRRHVHIDKLAKRASNRSSHAVFLRMLRQFCTGCVDDADQRKLQLVSQSNTAAGKTQSLRAKPRSAVGRLLLTILRDENNRATSDATQRDRHRGGATSIAGARQLDQMVGQTLDNSPRTRPLRTTRAFDGLPHACLRLPERFFRLLGLIGGRYGTQNIDDL